MPKFSQKSKNQLSTCDPRLIKLFEEVIKKFDCTVKEGTRSYTRQKDLLKKGFTKTLASKHVYKPSLAVDVIPYPTGYSNIKTMCYFAGYVKGVADTMDIPIKWGGDWNNNDRIEDKEWFDGAHFEIVDG